MAGENDNLIEGILGMLGDNPEEKINELLGSLKSTPQASPLMQRRRSTFTIRSLEIFTLCSLIPQPQTH